MIVSNSFNLLGDPSIIILNTDNTITWILQTYSFFSSLIERDILPKFHCILAVSLKIPVKKFIVVDYRDMSIKRYTFGKNEVNEFLSII